MQKPLFKSAITAVFARFFLLISGIFLTLTIHAQTDNRIEGYYLNLKRDTVKGFFTFDDLEQNRIAFYANKSSEDYSTLRPDDVKALETNKLSIISFIYGYEKALFLTKCYAKNIALYKSYLNEGEVFFISTLKNPDFVKITKENPKLFFDTYFNVCKRDKDTAIEYTEKGLVEVVEELNKCAPSETTFVPITTRLKWLKPLKIGIGLKYGLLKFNENPTIEGTYEGVYSVSNTTSFFSLMGILNYNSFSLKVGAYSFSKSLVRADSLSIKVHTIEHGGANFYYKTTFSFSYDIFEVPIELTYYAKFIHKKITPMVSLGMAYSSVSNVKVNQNASSQFYKYDTFQAFPLSLYAIPSGPPSIKDFNAPESRYNFFFSVGVNGSLTRNLAIELSGRFISDKDNFTTDQGSISVKTNRMEYAAALLYTFGKK